MRGSMLGLMGLSHAQIAPETNNYMLVKNLDGMASGAGSGVVASVSLQHNAGYIQLGGRNFYVLTYTPQRNFGGYDLMDGLAIRDDGADIALFYLYCQGGQLKYVFHESYFIDAASVGASGTCSDAQTDYSSRAFFPAITALPPGIDVGFSIMGSDLSLTGSKGQVRGSDGITRTFTTMAKVDCSKCPGGPWYEVHGIMDERPNDACFGILYLFPSNYNSVRLSYSLCMPELKSIDKVFSASWRPTNSLSDRAFRPPAGLPWRSPFPDPGRNQSILSEERVIV